jgi:autonomous glycyl radical cofactor GrcA
MIKKFESYFDKKSPWTEPDGDAILTAFDNGKVNITKEVEVKPAFRATGDITETSFRFDLEGRKIFVLYIEYPNRDPQIIIRINGYFSDIPYDSEYRKEILKRCFDSTK